MSVCAILDRTIAATTTGTESSLVLVSRLQTADAEPTTKVTETLEIGTNGLVGGVAQLGSFKGKLDRQATSTKLLGLITGKHQDPTPSATTEWTYQDLAAAEFDYVRFVADARGKIFGSFVAQDNVLESFEASVKSTGEATETFSTMGKHLTNGRFYGIGKAYVVVTGDVSGATIPIGADCFGTDEVPIEIPAPSGSNPSKPLLDTGRLWFLKIAIIPISARAIGGKNYPAGAWVRLNEVASGSSMPLGTAFYDSSAKTIKFGDPIVIGDIVHVLFASYGSDSSPTQVGLTEFDDTDNAGVPGRTVYATIGAYNWPFVQDFQMKVSIGRKEVQGFGANEVVFGTAAVQATTYSFTPNLTDFDIDSLLQTGSTALGSGHDIFDAEYLTRYSLKTSPAITITLKDPVDNATPLLQYITGAAVFESGGGISGAVNAELQHKFTGKDIGQGPTISATTPA